MVDPQEDIPDYDGLEDEAFPPLPPPHSPGQGGGEDGDLLDGENGEVSRLADVPAAKRKGVKRPQPKLDSLRLTSDRGLPALRTLFDNVRFKGKGCEAEDLQLLIQKMENWAHRLFPKLQFEDFIDRVEKLGNKKDVQTCLKRIRLDMPLTHEDFTGEEELPPESHIFGDLDPLSATAFPDDLQGVIHSTPAPPTQPPPSTSPFSSTAAPSLTEEQRRRMELNRQRALERKMARQQQRTDPSGSQTVDSSVPEDDPTSVSSANNLDSSRAQDEVEDLDLELRSSSSSKQQQEQQEQLSDLQDGDCEPSAEAAQSEREEESSVNAEQQPGDECC